MYSFINIAYWYFKSKNYQDKKCPTSEFQTILTGRKYFKNWKFHLFIYSFSLPAKMNVVQKVKIMTINICFIFLRSYQGVILHTLLVIAFHITHTIFSFSYNLKHICISRKLNPLLKGLTQINVFHYNVVLVLVKSVEFPINLSIFSWDLMNCYVALELKMIY